MNGAMPVYEVGHSGGGDDMFGGGNFLWFILLIFFFGMGGNGFGLGGNAATGALTENYMQNRFDTNTMINKLDGLTNGLSDVGYALNNSIKDASFANATGLCNLGNQMAQCCCETQRNIDSLRYDMSTLFCQTNHNISDSTASILQAICNAKYEDVIREQQQLIDSFQYNSLLAAINAKTTTTTGA